MITSSCATLFFILYTRYALGTMFLYAPQHVESIRERSLSYVLEERPNLYEQCLHSNVCSEDVDERWERCEEAVRTDACRHEEIELAPRSMFTSFDKPRVYGFVLFGSYEDIILACACPTKPKLILLADAQGSSEGQVNLMIYEPKSLTTKQHFDVYASKWTDKVKEVLPGEGKSKDVNDGDYLSHSPDWHRAAGTSKPFVPMTQQLGAYKDKVTGKIKDTLLSDSKVTKSYNKSLSDDSLNISAGGFSNDPSNVLTPPPPPPPPPPAPPAAKSSADVKHHFWQPKKETSAAVVSENVGGQTSAVVSSDKRATSAAVESENVGGDQTTVFVRSGLTQIPSFGDSRFESFNFGKSDSDEDDDYQHESDHTSPKSPIHESSERNVEEPEESEEFDNPFANMGNTGTGQSSTSRETNESSDQKKPSRRHKIRAKVKKTVKNVLKP